MSPSSSTPAASAGFPTRTSTARTIPPMPGASGTKPMRFGLATRIFVGCALLVVAVLGASFGITALSATRTADAGVARALAGTRSAVATLLAARTRTLAGMSAVSAGVPQFRERLLTSRERANVLDQAQEYRDLIGAAWILVTDDQGILRARTDYPEQYDRDLSRGALIGGALSGTETEGAWLDDVARRLYMAVATPLAASAQAAPQGVLVAAYALDDSLAQAVKQATNSDVVFFALDTLNHPYVVGSTLPRDEVGAALAADSGGMGSLTSDSSGMELSAQVGGEHLIGLGGPIRSAGNDVYGGFVPFRSHEAELAAFRTLQRTMVLALAFGVLLSLALAFILARHIARPVQRLPPPTRPLQAGAYP